MSLLLWQLKRCHQSVPEAGGTLQIGYFAWVSIAMGEFVITFSVRFNSTQSHLKTTRSFSFSFHFYSYKRKHSQTTSKPRTFQAQCGSFPWRTSKKGVGCSLGCRNAHCELAGHFHSHYTCWCILMMHHFVIQEFECALFVTCNNSNSVSSVD